MTTKSASRDNKKILTDIAYLISGAVIYSLAVSVFFSSSGVAIGGFTGISTILHRLFGTPIGLVVFVLNIPMFLICWKVFGFRFITKTIITLSITSALIDLFDAIIPPFFTDKILCALFGGLTLGLGMGILFMRGFTSGGSDLVAWLLKLRFRGLSTGLLIFMFDFVVVASAALIFRQPESALYSVIAIYSSTRVIDTVMGMSGRAKLAFIISERFKEISDSLAEKMERGVTVLDGTGWYTKSGKKIIMCVVGRDELYLLKEIVSEADSAAFMVLSDANEVIGEGFRAMSK